MENFSFPFQQTSGTTLPAHIQQLIEEATKATHFAYAPYSQFKVGAAALLADGSIKTGSNHENASYPAGICAERGLLSGINPLDKQQQILAMAVCYTSNTDNNTPLSPCGICRQTILEMQLAQDAPIAMYMCSPDGQVIYVEDAAHLLPFYFSSKNLKSNGSIA
jgi:cytidine deaminase